MLVACSASGDHGESSPRALLDALATAEQAGDTVAVRALLDPQASTSFVSAELARTENLKAVPLSTWRYRIDGNASGGPVLATLEYAVGGADPIPAQRPLQIRVVERSGRWLLAGFDDAPGARSYRAPWDFARVIFVRAGDRAAVIAHPGWERLGADVANLLPDAVARDSDAVGGGWQGNIVVFLTASDQEYAALGGTDGTAATTVSDAIGPGEPTGQRVVFAPSARTRLDQAELDVVLRHELVHVATRGRTAADTPLWVTEGFADFVAYRGAGRVEPQTSGLPADSSFTGADANRAYASARTVFAFVDRTCGDRAAVRFYDALASGEPLADVSVRICGRDEQAFLQSWREWTLHS